MQTQETAAWQFPEAEREGIFSSSVIGGIACEMTRRFFGFVELFRFREAGSWP
jgi:hypothetical protein